MKKAVLLLCCFGIAIVANALDVESVPMLDCMKSNSSCVYEAAWYPNGTIRPDQWTYFSFDLTDLDFEDTTSGLIADLKYLSGQSSIAFYLTKSLPLDYNSYMSWTNSTCDLPSGAKCYLNFATIDSGCATSKQLWYVSVHNIGKTAATFALTVEVDANTIFGCQFAKSLLDGIEILLISVTSVFCLACCACVLIICFCIRRSRSRHHHCHGYSQLPTTTVHATLQPYPYQMPPTNMVYATGSVV